MPVPEATERQFGKGKSNDDEAPVVEEKERQFAVEMKDGKIRLNKELLTRGN
jgi:hypothetical protein